MSQGFRGPLSGGINETLKRGAANLIRESGLGEIFSTKPRAKFASGARTIIRVNGKPLAFAFKVSWNINTQQTAIRTIDDYLPYEYAPAFIEVSGQISGWHIPGVGPTQLEIQQNVLSFLFHKYIQIEVRDRTTDALLFFTKNAVITSKSESIGIDDLAQLTLDFKAIGWKDEKDPKLPNLVRGNNALKDDAASLQQKNESNLLENIQNPTTTDSLGRKFRFPNTTALT